MSVQPYPAHSAIPYGHCHCGCGELAPLADGHHASAYKKGEPYPYILEHRPIRMIAPSAIWQEHKDSGLPYKQMMKIFVERFDYRCFYCREKGTLKKGPDGRAWNKDHKIPQSRGGFGTKDNLVLCCHTCNRAKGSKTAEEYLALCAS